MFSDISGDFFVDSTLCINLRLYTLCFMSIIKIFFPKVDEQSKRIVKCFAKSAIAESQRNR